MFFDWGSHFPKGPRLLTLSPPPSVWLTNLPPLRQCCFCRSLRLLRTLAASVPPGTLEALDVWDALVENQRENYGAMLVKRKPLSVSSVDLRPTQCLLPALKPLLRLANVGFDVALPCCFSQRASQGREKHCRQLLKPPSYPRGAWVGPRCIGTDAVVSLFNSIMHSLCFLSIAVQLCLLSPPHPPCPLLVFPKGQPNLKSFVLLSGYKPVSHLLGGWLAPWSQSYFSRQNRPLFHKLFFWSTPMSLNRQAVLVQDLAIFCIPLVMKMKFHTLKKQSFKLLSNLHVEIVLGGIVSYHLKTCLWWKLMQSYCCCLYFWCMSHSLKPPVIVCETERRNAGNG